MWTAEDWERVLDDLTCLYQRYDLAEEVYQLNPFNLEHKGCYTAEISEAGFRRWWLELKNHSYLTYDEDFGVIYVFTPDETQHYSPFEGTITSNQWGVRKVSDS